MGLDWFRQYLVIEFAEEGLDLWKANRDMLERGRLKDERLKDDEARAAATAAAAASGGKEHVVAEGGDGEGGEEGGAAAARGGGEEGAEAADFDFRTSGRELFDRFIKSGCGAECNLPGTVVRKVSLVSRQGGGYVFLCSAKKYFGVFVFCKRLPLGCTILLCGV